MKNNILALDASTEALSLALQYEGKLYHHFEVCPQQHSQKILPLVDKLLGEAGVKLQQLDAIAFGRGPGSFTGVRISVAIAQGLAYAAKLPVIGVSTLQAMAQQAIEESGAKQVLSAIDARMGELYFAQFSATGDGLAVCLGGETVVKPEELDLEGKAGVAVGTGWGAYPALLEGNDAIARAENIALPDARFMLKQAELSLASGEAVSADKAEPVYVRDTVTWKKLPGRE